MMSKQPAPSVDEALAELREMFPDSWFSIEVSERPIVGRYCFIRVYGKPKQVEPAKTLAEAMQKVRDWKEKHGQSS